MAATPPARNRGTPHRCNDRLEDAIQGLFEGNWDKNLWPLVKVFRECMDSEVGKEPSAPYRFVTPQARTPGKQGSPGEASAAAVPAAKTIWWRRLWGGSAPAGDATTAAQGRKTNQTQ